MGLSQRGERFETGSCGGGWHFDWRAWARCWEAGAAAAACGSPCPAAPSVQGLLRWELGDLLGLDGLSAPRCWPWASRRCCWQAAPGCRGWGSPAGPGTGSGRGPPPLRRRTQPPPGADNASRPQAVDPAPPTAQHHQQGCTSRTNPAGPWTRRCWETGSSRLSPAGPQVLIVHSHASEGLYHAPGPGMSFRHLPHGGLLLQHGAGRGTSWQQAVVLRHLRGPRSDPPRRPVLQRRL